MNDIKKIVWACDFYKVSTNALKYAEIVAKAFDAEIIALTVVQQPCIAHYKLPFDASSQIKNYARSRTGKAEKIFSRMVKQEKQKKIKFNYVIKEGRAHEEISNVVLNEKADLVIMGSRGAHEGILVGSTATKVVKTCHIPAMVVKKVKKEGKISRILIPTDLTHHWAEAFDLGVKIADRLNAEVYIVHIIEIYSYEGIEEVYDKLLSQATTMVEECCDSIKKKAGNLRIYEFARKATNAPAGILNFIEQKNIDLVVMQTHARTGAGKFLLGSVTEKILNQTNIPVIVVHHHEEKK